MRSLEEKKENFQLWIFNISDDLEELIKDLKNDELDLDFTIESLDVIENWVLSKFESIEILIQEQNKLILDKLSKYVGEVFRKNIGGKWSIELENEKDVYYNIPTLKGENISIPIAPMTYITACISRNKGNYISSILRNLISRMNKK